MSDAVLHDPKIFSVNWFRKDAEGRFVWPGFGQNMRVLKWIVERCHGRAGAVETPLGLEPAYGDLTWAGVDFPPEQFASVMRMDATQWRRELAEHEALFTKVGDKLPRALADERAKLVQRFAG